MSYSLYLLPRVEKEIAALDSRPYESVKKKIDSLREEPRPPGCRKPADSQDWRIRAGDYRIVYQIDDAAKKVIVLAVGHRREIYR